MKSQRLFFKHHDIRRYEIERSVSLGHTLGERILLFVVVVEDRGKLVSVPIDRVRRA